MAGSGGRLPSEPEVAESGGRVLECVEEDVSGGSDSSRVCRMVIDWSS